MSRSDSDADLARFLVEQGFAAITLTCNAVGHFELPAQIDGAAVRLLLDTGASRTVLDRSSAERLNLSTQASSEHAGGVGTATHALSGATLQQFSLDGMDLGSMRVFVMDLSHVNQSLEARGGTRIDGALGGDVLRPRQAIIDYARSTLYLRPESQSEH